MHYEVTKRVLSKRAGFLSKAKDRIEIKIIITAEKWEKEKIEKIDKAPGLQEQELNRLFNI